MNNQIALPSPSLIAQRTFSLKHRIRAVRFNKSSRWRLWARIVDQILQPAWGALASARPIVTADLYGHRLFLYADHRLPDIAVAVPGFNAPILDIVTAIAEQKSHPVVIDVGANIGDTVALIEASIPGLCSYLCVEPDEEFAALCRWNLSRYPNVQVDTSFVGDETEATATLVKHRPGTAATQLMATNGSSATGNVRRLDTIAEQFVRTHGGPHFIKIDTDGFDFAVLRSATELLQASHPAVLFEWHPALWKRASENIGEVFEFLKKFGYEDFLFFENRGSLHCKVQNPSGDFIDCLARIALARHNVDDFHYDVLASTGATISRTADLALARAARS